MEAEERTGREVVIDPRVFWQKDRKMDGKKGKHTSEGGGRELTKTRCGGKEGGNDGSMVKEEEDLWL